MPTRKPPDRTKKKTMSRGQQTEPMVCLPSDQWEILEKQLAPIPVILRNQLQILNQLSLWDKKLKTYNLENCSINNLQITSSGKNSISFQGSVEGSGQNEDQLASDQSGTLGDQGFALSPPNSGPVPVLETTSMQPVEAVTDWGHPLAFVSDYDSGVEMSDCDSFSFADDSSIYVWSDSDISDDDSVIASDGYVHDIDDGGQLGVGHKDPELLGVSLDDLAPAKSGLFKLVKCTSNPIKGMLDVATGPPGPASSHSGAAHCVSVSSVTLSLTASVITPEIPCGTPMAVQHLQAAFQGQSSCLEKFSDDSIVVPAKVLREVEHDKLLSCIWPKANFIVLKPIYSQQFPISLSTSRESEVMFFSGSFGEQVVAFCHMYMTSISLTGRVVEQLYKGADNGNTGTATKSARGAEEGDEDIGRIKFASEALAVSHTANKKAGESWHIAFMRSIRFNAENNDANRLQTLQGGFKTSGRSRCSSAAPVYKPDQSLTGIPSHCSTGIAVGDIRLVLSPIRVKKDKDNKTCETDAGHGEPAAAYLPHQARQGGERRHYIKNMSISLDTERLTIQKSLPYFHRGDDGCGSTFGKKMLQRCKDDRSGHRIHKQYGVL